MVVIRSTLAPVALLLLILGLTSLPEAHADDDACPPVTLDRILHVNGKVFEGHIVSQDDRGVTLEFVSPSGGSGRLFFPYKLIQSVERGTVEALPDTPSSVRNAWYLLRSESRVVGTRHLRLRRVRTGDVPGWRLEEHIIHFARGPHVPTTRIHRMETVDDAFRPLKLHYREVGEASMDPTGPRRYERILTGPVSGGIWTALVQTMASNEQQAFEVPAGLRGRLGVREHLLRSRETGLADVVFFDAGRPGPVSVRAGYAGLGLRDGNSLPYDEFVWEEGDQRLLSRFRDAEVVTEAIAEGVTAVPVTRAQAEAAAQASERKARADEADLVRLADVGVSFRLPGETWKLLEVERSPVARGWRRVAATESRFHVADVRVEWDPTGAQMTPTAEEAETRLLARLKRVCPDLRVVRERRPLSGTGAPSAAWRMTVEGTLNGERVRTTAVVIDRGAGRVLFLAAAPNVAWEEANVSFERLFSSIRVM